MTMREGTAGGIYLFDTEEHARVWGDEMLPNSLGRLPGLSEVDARYFDVDERLTAITRGRWASPRRCSPRSHGTAGPSPPRG